MSLRPPLAFNPRLRRLSTPPDAFELHPDFRLYRMALSLVHAARCVKRVAPADVSTAEALLRAAAASNDAGDAVAVAAADAELALLLCQ